MKEPSGFHQDYTQMYIFTVCTFYGNARSIIPIFVVFLAEQVKSFEPTLIVRGSSRLVESYPVMDKAQTITSPVYLCRKRSSEARYKRCAIFNSRPRYSC